PSPAGTCRTIRCEECRCAVSALTLAATSLRRPLHGATVRPGTEAQGVPVAMTPGTVFPWPGRCAQRATRWVGTRWCALWARAGPATCTWCVALTLRQLRSNLWTLHRTLPLLNGFAVRCEPCSR